MSIKNYKYFSLLFDFFIALYIFHIMKKLNIGLIGFGTIGTGVAKLINKNKKLICEKTGVTLELKKIADIDIKTNRGVKINKNILTTDADEILGNNDIDIVIELVGGTGIAKQFVLKALKSGQHVVTANKALLSKFGKQIFKTAEKNKTYIQFEASVGGGIPIIKVIKESLVANKIQQIYGIMNGTTNYILTKMEEERIDFRDALKQAQKLGFAEADPTLDISGGDAAHKLQILASLGFNKYIEDTKIYHEGIENIDLTDINYVADLGYKIKLLAIAKIENKEIEVRVHPTIIPQRHLLSSIKDEFNAVYVKGDAMGPQLFYGKGAGALPTASAVVSDILDIAKKLMDNNQNYTEKFYNENSKLTIKNFNDITCRYYFRFHTEDKPGVLAKISSILGKFNISLTSVVQKETGQKVVPIVMLSHSANEKNVQNAIKEIKKLRMVKNIKIIRIEDLQ